MKKKSSSLKKMMDLEICCSSCGWYRELCRSRALQLYQSDQTVWDIDGRGNWLW